MLLSPYKKLYQLSKTASLMNAIHTLLDWDQETYMPKGAIELRSLQIEVMASLVHRQKTSKPFAKALSALIDLESGEVTDNTLSAPQISALHQWRRHYLQAVKPPNAFVRQFAKTTSAASHAWQSARETDDFKAFAPHLEKVVELSLEK